VWIDLPSASLLRLTLRIMQRRVKKQESKCCYCEHFLNCRYWIANHLYGLPWHIFISSYINLWSVVSFSFFFRGKTKNSIDLQIIIKIIIILPQNSSVAAFISSRSTIQCCCYLKHFAPRSTQNEHEFWLFQRFFVSTFICNPRDLY